MMRLDAIVTLFPDLEIIELHHWIDQRWVRPERVGPTEWVFHDIDLARVRLIYDLRRDMETPEETVPLVLSLLDQVYELRGVLNIVSQAVETLSPESREAILVALRDDCSSLNVQSDRPRSGNPEGKSL